MSKNLLFLTGIMISTFLQSQIIISTKALISFREPEQNIIISGLGLGLYVGASAGHKVDFVLGGEKHWISSKYYKEEYSDLAFDIRYRFFYNSFQPYISLGVGYYMKTNESDRYYTYYEKAFGIRPQMGIILKTKALENIYFHADYMYNIIWFKKEMIFYTFGIGLIYRFQL